MNSRPKRRKSKDNPYVIKYLEEENVYVVEFKFNNIKKIVKINEDVYNAFNQFELDDLKILNEYDRHIEHLDQTDEFLFKRSIMKNKSIEDEIEEKFLYDALKKSISSLTEIQKRRIKMYFFDNMNLTNIAKKEKCSIESVKESINSAIKKLKKYKNF